MRLARVAVVAGAVALAGCGPREVSYEVVLITRTCEASVDPLAGVRFIELAVSGPGIPPVVSSVPVEQRRLTAPGIPAGPDRVFEVRGYDGDPAGAGRVVSVGRSLPVDVPDVVPGRMVGLPDSVTVFLRRVGTFSPVVSAASPTACQAMTVPRAGHTATLLASGRVLIAGGFALRPGSSERQAHASMEVFDPSTGMFDQVRDLGFVPQGGTAEVPLPRAFHTAARLPSGQVVLWGGETYGPAGPAPQASIFVYDPDDPLGVVGVVQAGERPVPRAHHVMAVDDAGRVLVAGGVTAADGAPALPVEWLDADDAAVRRLAGVEVDRQEALAATLGSGQVIIAGGQSSAGLSVEPVAFEFAGAGFTRVPLAADLRTPGRRAPGGGAIRGGRDLILVGGFADVKDQAALASTEIVVLGGPAPSVEDGPVVSARARPCTATLPGGELLVVGGRTGLGADGASERITVGTSQAVSALGGPTLPIPRFAHTCTTLSDGTVLVTGGVDDRSGGEQVLADAWIYTPRPAK